MHAVRVVHETWFSWVSPLSVPFGPLWVNQLEPFQSSVRASVVALPPPTAAHRVGDMQDTPFRSAIAALGNLGVD